MCGGGDGGGNRICRAERSNCFCEFFANLPDPRQRGKVAYPLNEILLACLLAVCSPERRRLSISRDSTRRRSRCGAGFLPFHYGTPSHDHLGDIFATLDATESQRRFVAWVAKLIGVSADVIAFDGQDVARF